MNNFLLREIEKNEIDKNKGDIKLESDKQIIANQLLNKGIDLSPIVLKKKSIIRRFIDKIFKKNENKFS